MNEQTHHDVKVEHNFRILGSWGVVGWLIVIWVVLNWILTIVLIVLSFVLISHLPSLIK